MGSLFGNLEFDYDDWLTLSAGLRYDRYRLEGETGMNISTFTLGTTQQVTVPLRYDVDREEGRFSPTFGISVRPGVDWLQLFARYVEGWRPPAVLISGRPHGGSAPTRSSSRSAPSPGRWGSTSSHGASSPRAMPWA